MSYLLDFIKTFDDKEMEQFRRLDLRGKEEQIRDAYLYAGDKKFDEIKLPARYELSQAHFDKITSVLLDKTICYFYQDDYNKTLSTILQKGLSQLMLHELKIMERRVLKKADKSEYPVFYRAAFNNLRSMFHPGYSPELTQQYGKKYLDSLGSAKTIADESYVEMLAVYGDTLYYARAGEEATYIPIGKRRLELWKKKTEAAGDAEATFYYAFARATFLKILTEDLEGYRNAVGLMRESYAKAPDRIEERYKGIVAFESGFACMESNDFDGAYKYYSQNRRDFKETLGDNVYHTGHYIMSCLLTGHYDEAIKAVGETYLPRIRQKVNRSMLFDIYTITCMTYLHKEDYATAYQYVKELQTYRSNEITRFGQALMRQIETLYHLAIGDYDTARIMVKRNLKFLKAENSKANATFGNHTAFVNMMNKIVLAKNSANPKKEELHRQVDSLQKGVYVAYNMLLTRVIDRDL